MLFTSYAYVFFFFCFVLPLRWLLPRRLASPFLLAASLAFYASWSWKYTLGLIGLTVATHLVARAISGHRKGEKTLVYALAIAGLLLVLGYFKYANFVLAQLHLEKRLDVALPLGISFFVFEMISYLVDVWRGTPPAESFAQFLLYIAYFPHLIAGPIVRATELLPQLQRPMRFDSDKASEGMFIALTGFAKKMIFADNLAVVADIVFADPGAQSTSMAWLGVAAYTGQIFCDFSGYTDIARGCSLMIGLQLPDNFDYPYGSASITEFWRRWHMTLSRWLRDYLYISLGGSRRGRLATYRNLFLTMLLGGLWHGANWTFVAWGAFHGTLLALHKAYLELTKRVPWMVSLRSEERPVIAYRVLSIAVTLLLVMIGWVLFRATTFTAAWTLLGRMFHYHPPALARSAEVTLAMRLLVALVFMHVLGVRRAGLRSHRAMTPAVRGVVWATLIAGCYVFASGSPVFIYFSF
jgi:alginate O-acetyltransferase complex protein AlgI